MSSKTHKPLIAVIDDDAAICEAIRRLISTYGMEVQIFNSGREFIDRLDSTASFRPDCVLLDVQMPGMSGLEVQMQLSWRRSGTPVIFITSSSERWIYEEALGAGAAAFFLKPFDAEVLVGAVRESLVPRWDH